MFGFLKKNQEEKQLSEAHYEFLPLKLIRCRERRQNDHQQDAEDIL